MAPSLRRGAATRQLLLDTAERLIAERGVADVSHRRIAEAAGQANNSAVAYHVGDRADLVVAIMRSHVEALDRHRERLLDGLTETDGLRDRIACLVLPSTRHLAEIGVPSHYARFTAQVSTDPVLRRLVLDETVSTPSMRRAIDGVLALLPELPADVAQARSDMARHVVVHTCAERERALADRSGSTPRGWDAVGEELTDALTGLLTAPHARGRHTEREHR